MAAEDADLPSTLSRVSDFSTGFPSAKSSSLPRLGIIPSSFSDLIRPRIGLSPNQ